MATEIVQSLCPTRGYCKPIKHLFLLFYFLFYSLFFTESININENKREFSNNKCQVMHRCPRIDKGWERCRVFPPHHRRLVWLETHGFCSNAPTGTTQGRYLGSPAQHLPRTVHLQMLQRERPKRSPPHAVGQTSSLDPVRGEQAKGL